MWAQKLTAPGRFELIEVQAPTAEDLSAGEVLLRTLAGGMCGSDFPYFRGQVPLAWGQLDVSSMANAPGFPLHEIVGEVVASRADGLDMGSRVVGWASGTDGLAEFIVSSAAGLAAYDQALDPGSAVALQPLACVLDAASRIPGFEGRSVAVLGLGPIGLLFGHVARDLGARRIVGIDRVARDDLRETFGFDSTLHVSTQHWAADLHDDQRPDIVIEAIGHQQSTVGHAVEALAQDGLLYYFGIPDDVNYSIPLQTLLRKNLTLMTGITVRKQEALAAARSYLSRYPDLAERYVTNRFKASDATRAFEMAIAPSEGRVKIVIEFP